MQATLSASRTTSTALHHVPAEHTRTGHAASQTRSNSKYQSPKRLRNPHPRATVPVMVTPSDLIFGLASLRDCCYCILSFLLLPAHSFIPTSNVVFDSWCLEAMRCGAGAFRAACPYFLFQYR